jgi:hypothetical protein
MRGVSFASCGLDVVPGPDPDTALLCRLLFGSPFQGTDPGFHSAIVCRPVWRRVQGRDSGLLQEGLHFRGPEGGAVVRFEGEPRLMPGKQRTQHLLHGLCSGIPDRQPGQLLAAGGLDTVVQRTPPQIDTEMTYISQTSST